ncbi:non-ribosomal peptide synthetase, partial [Streptomyces triticagri]
VDQTLVTTTPDADGNPQLTAYLTQPTHTDPLTAGELRSFLAERLTPAMVPARLVRLDTFPLLTNGKIDLNSLAGAAGEELVAQREYEPPAGPLEEVLAGIWADVLGREQVGVHDDFYDLGGHSLLATQVVSRVRTLLRIEVSLRSFVGISTVRQLAALARTTGSQEGLDADQIAGLVLQISRLSQDEAAQQLRS